MHVVKWERAVSVQLQSVEFENQNFSSGQRRNLPCNFLSTMGLNGRNERLPSRRKSYTSIVGFSSWLTSYGLRPVQMFAKNSHCRRPLEYVCAHLVAYQLWRPGLVQCFWYQVHSARLLLRVYNQFKLNLFVSKFRLLTGSANEKERSRAVERLLSELQDNGAGLHD